MGKLWEYVKQDVNRQLAEQKERDEQKKLLKEYKKKGIPYCPKCYSTSLSANKKGFGVGKAVIGASIAGPIGLVAGNIHAKKVRLTCLNCGHQFYPGKK